MRWIKGALWRMGLGKSSKETYRGLMSMFSAPLVCWEV